MTAPAPFLAPGPPDCWNVEPPLALDCGSGKFGSPCERMHCENFRPFAWLALMSWGVALALPPSGAYFWQAVCAAWKAGLLGSRPPGPDCDGPPAPLLPLASPWIVIDPSALASANSTPPCPMPSPNSPPASPGSG